MLEENLMQSVVCRFRSAKYTAVVCRGVPDREMQELYEGMMCLVCITCRLTLWALKHGFSHCNVGKLWCASICCVKQTMRKCLKISVKTLLIQIFFVYLPAFMRVMPSRTRRTLGYKCLKTNNLECNKAEIDNF